MTFYLHLRAVSATPTNRWRLNCGIGPMARRALLLAAVFVTCSCSSAPPPSLAITHVTLIDATGAAAKPDMTVFIAGEQIAAIGPSSSVSIPRTTKTLDARGRFLMPGLVDMHVHLTGA